MTDFARRRAIHPGVIRLAISVGSIATIGTASSLPAMPAHAVGARVIRVDPNGSLNMPSLAARIARDGDTVEIEPGIYRADVAVWPQASLRIRARVPGSVRLIADGAAAEEKAIWVFRNGQFDIEGIAFEGARVIYANGAGIRFERGSLRLARCRFAGNEMGVLTGNDPSSHLIVDQCEFEGRREGRQFGHNLYVGAIASVRATDSWFHTGFKGHLLKTRARRSEVIDCRLVDGPHGQASYELEFPNGGDVLMQRNRIVQEPTTQNLVMVSYGAEGYPYSLNCLEMTDNSLENHASTGVFVRVSPGAIEVSLKNNRFLGHGSFQGVTI